MRDRAHGCGGTALFNLPAPAQKEGKCSRTSIRACKALPQLSTRLLVPAQQGGRRSHKCYSGTVYLIQKTVLFVRLGKLSPETLLLSGPEAVVGLGATLDAGHVLMPELVIGGREAGARSVQHVDRAGAGY